MKLLLDAMFSPVVATQLRQRGHDVSTVVELGDLRTAADPVIFAAAQGEWRAVVTENVRDYHIEGFAALNRGEEPAGLIFTTNARFPRADPRTVGRLVTALDEVLRSGVNLAGREYWLR